MEILRNEAWITEKANEILSELVLSNKNLKVLEFGAGASTIWFLKQQNVIELISVESDINWINTVLANIPKNPIANFNLKQLDTPYNNVCYEFSDEYFDIILVDGRNRNKCMISAIPKLKKGGVLILDNSERGYYKKELFEGWKTIETVQDKPDKYNFTYQDPENLKYWSTTFFIKDVV
jgi:predicted O-methyltransferase YrrM